MASAAPKLLTVEEFLAIQWDSSDVKAELDCGVVRMMAGGTGRHARVQGQIQGSLFVKLRGSGCRPFGPDMGLRTRDISLRYPDVAVYCGKDGGEFGAAQSFDDPKLIVEVLSPTTRSKDFGVKLREYKQLPSLHYVLLVDPDDETVTLVTRNGGDWETSQPPQGGRLRLEELGIELDWDDLFG